jgi:hypothetical protein
VLEEEEHEHLGDEEEPAAEEEDGTYIPIPYGTFIRFKEIPQIRSEIRLNGDSLDSDLPDDLLLGVLEEEEHEHLGDEEEPAAEEEEESIAQEHGHEGAGVRQA